MNQKSFKYNFEKDLKSILSKESNFEVDCISYIDYSEKINHNRFVVYEDWWIAKPEVILSKIKAILGESERIFARKTAVLKLDKHRADKFLEENHIYGTVKAKHKLGLLYQDKLVAVATFSPQRNLSVGRSVELVRFASIKGSTVIGGLDKLIKYYEREFNPDHMMTYVDKDWGSGDAFLKLGFNKSSEREEIQYCVDIKTGLRSPITKANKVCNLKVWNRGSIKFEKYCEIK